MHSPAGWSRVFWPDDVSLPAEPPVRRERIVRHRQVTDAHLLALAIRRGGRLVTFDRGVLALVPDGTSPETVLDLID